MVTPCRECPTCPILETCSKICDDVETLLPSMETGRIDYEDLPNLYIGRIMRRTILDNEDMLTDKQKEVVRLYYREGLLQKDISLILKISQQAVSDHLESVRDRLWKQFRKNRQFKAAAQARGVFD